MLSGVSGQGIADEALEEGNELGIAVEDLLEELKPSRALGAGIELDVSSAAQQVGGIRSTQART